MSGPKRAPGRSAVGGRQRLSIVELIVKERITAIWHGLPQPIKDYTHTMLVGAGIGALTAGTAKIFQKLNVPHPAAPAKPQRPYQPYVEHPHQQPRWQPGQKSWAKGEQQRRYHNPNGRDVGHGRG